MFYKNFNKWIDSEKGKSCGNFDNLTSNEYLKNRLWWAFKFGYESADVETIEQMHKVVNEAHRTIGELRKEIEELIAKQTYQ